MSRVILINKDGIIDFASWGEIQAGKNLLGLNCMVCGKELGFDELTHGLECVGENETI